MGAFNDFVLFFSLAGFFGFLFFYYKYQHSHQALVEISDLEFEGALLDMEIQHEKDQGTYTENSPQFSTSLDTIPGDFLPGTLDISPEEVLRQCYLEPDQADQHRGKSQCVVSDQHKLIFFLVPKTGSSTNRVAFRDILNGTDGNKFCTNKIPAYQRAYRTVVTVREPLSRFFSQYMEAEFRSSMNDNNKMAKFEWWHEEDKMKRFLKFVDYWHKNTMKDVLDTHFRLQAPMLSWYDGSVRRIDWFMPLETLDESWDELKELLGVETGPKKAQKARKNRNPTVDKHKVSDEYKRKICQIVAIDYCCLNYELPKVCEGAVTCSYKKRIDTATAARYIVPNKPPL